MDSTPPREATAMAIAIRPSALETARSKCIKARQISQELENAFLSLKRKIEPETASGEEEPVIDVSLSCQLTSLGIELASRQKESILLEREVVKHESDARILDSREAEKRLRELNRRYISVGGDLWRHTKKKTLLESLGTIRLLDRDGGGFSEATLCLYKKLDRVFEQKRTPSRWNQDAVKYYNASGSTHDGVDNGAVFCQMSGGWAPKEGTKAAHIVPFFMDSDEIGELLFGSRAQSLGSPGNALIMIGQIQSWFDSYYLVVVPVDPSENPITRWRTDLISSHIQNCLAFPGYKGKELDGKELVFLNDNRPVPRFLYFHFIMALVRIKDMNRPGWKDVWAKYYQQRPFATPGNYMRKAMLLALATHFGVSDMDVINSWIVDNGFGTARTLTDAEATEVARRVLADVEIRAQRAERP